MKYKINPNTKCKCSNTKHHATWILNTAGILKSIENIFKKQDIDMLTKDAYSFVYLMSGFIAHYDINGFKCYYQDLRLFADDLLRSSDCKDAGRYISDPFFSGDDQHAYYAQKTEILKQIPVIVEKYKQKIQTDFMAKERAVGLAMADALLKKYK